MSDGHVSVSVLAGPLEVTDQPMHPQIGQQITMGRKIHIHITPDIAKQWIQTLTPIATKEAE